MTALSDKIARGEFAITAEVVPPVAGNKSVLLANAEHLRGVVDAVNVTDGAGATTTMSSFAAAAILAANGIEPVLQVTCRDRNRIALTADLLGAAAQGVSNLLILMGDDPASGDQPEAKPVFDFDSRQVMQLARTMREDAVLPSGKAIANPPQFYIGAADMPLDPPADWKPDALQSKIDCGAQFTQTQFCFEPQVAERFIERLVDTGITEKVGVLLGIGPIVSVRSAHWMNENLFGVTIPAAIIARLEAATDAKAEGWKICAELIQQYRDIPGLAGVHIMAPGQGAQGIANVLEIAG